MVMQDIANDIEVDSFILMNQYISKANHRNHFLRHLCFYYSIILKGIENFIYTHLRLHGFQYQYILEWQAEGYVIRILYIKVIL